MKKHIKRALLALSRWQEPHSSMSLAPATSQAQRYTNILGIYMPKASLISLIVIATLSFLLIPQQIFAQDAIGPLSTPRESSNFCYSLSLDGTNSYMEVSSPADSSLDIRGPLTLEAWVKT